MNTRLAGLLLIAVALLSANQPSPINDDGSYFLYRPLMQAKPGHLPLDQGPIGTCVAVAHAGALDARGAIDKSAFRKFGPLKFACPESIYGGARNEADGRASNSYRDGSNGYEATRWLRDIGGVIYQQVYPGGYDLSTYDTKRAKRWGAEGNGGVQDGIGGPLDKEAAKTPVLGCALIPDLEQLDKALASGFPVTICSNVGFNSPRDSDGFCSPRGSWAHCMFVVGKRNEGRKGYLIQNSWGPYIKGDGANSTNKYKDQPDGSFYIEPSVMLRILKAGDSWAISFDGFKKAKLPDWMTDANATAPSLIWFTDYNAARTEAQVTVRPLIVLFVDSRNGKDSCDAAKLIVEQETLGTQVVAVVLDIASEPALSSHYSVRSSPTAFLHFNDKNLRFDGRDRVLQSIGDEL